jgi:hypothetical protein
VTGVIGLHRGGALVVLAACLALSAPAAAQSPDPDPSAGPRPDPAPTKSRTAKPTAPAPSAAQPTTTQTTPTPENESSPDSGAVRPRTSPPRRATHRAKRHKPSPARHVADSTAPALPRIEPTQLLAPASDDGDRARRLAVGAVALLLLGLASATLLAVTARLERRRMMR